MRARTTPAETDGHERAGGCAGQGRARTAGLLAAALLAVVLVTLSAAALPAAQAHAAVGRGLCVAELDRFERDPTVKDRTIAEVATQLRAGWVRLVVHWPVLEPSKGAYNQVYLADLDYTIAGLGARGVKVVVTFCYVPRWASDSTFWDKPPHNFPAGYHARYPIRAGALDDMGATAEMLAARYAGQVKAWECWNEPNLWPYIYPQRTADDEFFAARTYLKYLKTFSAGVRRGDPKALVVAGSTAPIGLNDRLRTSPQRFARFLKGAGAAAHFDVYSHHPYVPGCSFWKAPDRPPNDPTTTVTLYNLGQLLRLFPGKPFYLTEYGYNTSPSRDFGDMTVTRVQQAKYLRKAYAYAGRYSQVKNLFWFLVRDFRYGPEPVQGVYTGLRETTGTRKPSWFAFARGNRLTIEAPPAARAGSLVSVRGTLSSEVLGPLAGRRLLLQARPASGGPWTTIAATRTGSTGAYRFSLRPRTTRAYRVVWPGVRESAVRVVRVY